MKPTRERILKEQGGRCALCRLPCSEEQAVLDHDHATGAVRGVLHRGCNSLLGKIENNHKRYGVPNLSAWLSGVRQYIEKHVTNVTGLFHPTFKTPEEKRERRNKAARERRAAARAGKD